jgi:predicted HD phosphohydrolase
MVHTAKFTRLQDSTKEDFEIILPHEIAYASGLADRILSHLKLLDGDPAGYPVNRYKHSLQSATLAKRDGRDDEYVVCALLHDMGDIIGSYNHADIAASVLSPFVREENLWMVQNHGILQAYHFFHHIGLDRNLRNALRSHPHYKHTGEFVDLYDNPAFDPAMQDLPLEAFAPLVRKLFERPIRTLYSVPAPVTA